MSNTKEELFKAIEKLSESESVFLLEFLKAIRITD